MFKKLFTGVIFPTKKEVAKEFGITIVGALIGIAFTFVVNAMAMGLLDLFVK